MVIAILIILIIIDMTAFISIVSAFLSCIINYKTPITISYPEQYFIVGYEDGWIKNDKISELEYNKYRRLIKQQKF